MSQWWTYRPSDLLMYSAGSYERLLARLFESVWPLQLFMLLLGVGMCVAVLRWPVRQAPWSAGVLALVWSWLAWGYYLTRFTEISTAASSLAVLSIVEAAVLAALANLQGEAGRRSFRMAGVLMVVVALAWPALALVTGRSLAQAEWFGTAPETTALATLGMLLASPLRGRTWAAIVPALLLAVGLTTLWLLYAPV